MYGSLPQNQAYLLTQLRTGQSWLAKHGKLRCLREDEKCKCGAPETVVHVLVDCLRLKDLRQKLRRKIGAAFNNILNMLGGWTQGKEGKKDNVQDSSILGAVLDFAEASKRYRAARQRAAEQNTRQEGHHRP
jgi:hypothetical protein